MLDPGPLKGRRNFLNKIRRNIRLFAALTDRFRVFSLTTVFLDNAGGGEHELRICPMQHQREQTGH